MMTNWLLLKLMRGRNK